MPPIKRAFIVGILVLRTAGAFAGERDYQAIFNGCDLEGWSGEPGLWSVNHGVLRGESSEFRLSNTFLLWKGGTLRDFHLKLQARLHNGNSGIQYRSRDLGKWTVSGYQAEIANEPGKSGFLYEERGRKFVALLGESVRGSATGWLDVTSRLGAKADYLAWGYYRPRDWNRFEVIAKGPYLAHYVNGFKTAEFFDADKERARAEGVLALQIHAGTSMTVEFREILLQPF